MYKNHKKQAGFTIVELLIVIVVIAILAAISIVAYSGIQKRAETAARESELKNIKTKLEEFEVIHESFPASISDCPGPSSGNLCLVSDLSSRVQYAPIDSVSYGGSSSWVKPGYSLGLMSETNFIFEANIEQRGGNEFNRVVDIAPYIDKYGPGTYVLSFDLRSEDISQRNTISMYLQNGGDTRYNFSVPITATTEYKHHTIEVNPSGPNESVEKSYLAFYGTYYTGNVPIVKNISLHKK